MPFQRIEFRPVRPQKTVSRRHLLGSDALALQLGIPFGNQNLERRMPCPFGISRHYRTMPDIRTIAPVHRRDILH